MNIARKHQGPVQRAIHDIVRWIVSSFWQFFLKLSTIWISKHLGPARRVQNDSDFRSWDPYTGACIRPLDLLRPLHLLSRVSFSLSFSLKSRYPQFARQSCCLTVGSKLDLKLVHCECQGGVKLYGKAIK